MSKFFFDTQLRGDGAGIEMLDEEARKGLEPFVAMKMAQLKAYDNECAKRLLYDYRLVIYLNASPSDLHRIKQ
jgi:hypothetical protein